MTSIVQSNVELKVGCVKHNAGKNIRKLSYSGYNLTHYSSKKGYEEVNLAPYNTFDLCLSVSLFTDKNRQEQTRTVKNRQEALF